MLAGSVDQVTDLSTKRSSQESGDTEEILSLKVGNEQTKKTLEQIDSTFSHIKKSQCLWMEASVKEIDPSLWKSFQDQSYQMITQYVYQSAAVCVTGQVEPQYILCKVPTGVPCTVCCFGVRDPYHHDRGPTNLSQCSLTDLGNVPLNLSAGAHTLSVTPTALPEGNQ